MQSAALDVEGAARQLTDGEGYVLFERFFDDERLRYLLGVDQPYPALPDSNRRPVPVSRKDRAIDGPLPPYAVEVEGRR